MHTPKDDERHDFADFLKVLKYGKYASAYGQGWDMVMRDGGSVYSPNPWCVLEQWEQHSAFNTGVLDAVQHLDEVMGGWSKPF